jgi:hypothetical protein
MRELKGVKTPFRTYILFLMRNMTSSMVVPQAMPLRRNVILDLKRVNSQ